jgi:hypothetical protein
MFTYSDNTNYNLNFYYFIVSIYLRFYFFGNYSYVSDVSDDPDGILLSTAPITAPSIDEIAGICAIVAVVDTRRVLRVQETTASGECNMYLMLAGSNRSVENFCEAVFSILVLLFAGYDGFVHQ